jgi:hypothetical protein
VLGVSVFEAASVRVGRHAARVEQLRRYALLDRRHGDCDFCVVGAGGGVSGF